MINKIVCAFYGTENPKQFIDFIVYFAEKLKSEIILLYAKPRPYFEGLEDIPANHSKLYTSWIEDTAKREIKKLENISKNISYKGFKSKIEVREGVLYEEILDFADEVNADLIAVSRKKHLVNEPIPRTALKLIRQSDIPVITVNGSSKEHNIDNILVPTGLFDLNSNDLKYAIDLSDYFKSKIFQLNVLETEDYNFPSDLVFTYMDDAYKRISQMNLGDENIEQHVVESKNAYLGISGFVEDRDIDLIVMNTYRGEQGEKKDFIGSVAERVLQNVDCPIITIRPSF